MFFWNSLAFSMIQWMLAIWSLVPLPFLKPAWTSGSSWFLILLEPGLENFEHYFVSVWVECNCVMVCAFFSIAFLWDWNENWPFPVLCPLLSFPNLLAYWVSEAWHATIHAVAKSRTQLSDWTELNWLSAALSQHHLSEFEIAQLEFHHLHYLCL